MNPKQFHNHFEDIYQRRLERAEKLGREKKIPPWQVRKTREMTAALAHPDLYADVAILFSFSKESILKIHQFLIEYFVRSYGISDELAQTLVFAMVADNPEDVLDPHNQIDGVRYYNELEQIAGPANDKGEAYLNILSDIKRKDPHVNIRIGASATKKDVIWFIEKYWESEIEPAIGRRSSTVMNNKKPVLLRNRTIYALRRDGWKYSEIQAYIMKAYNNDLVDERDLRKIYERAKPSGFILHKLLEKQLLELDRSLIHDRNIAITLHRKPSAHFSLDIV